MKIKLIFVLFVLIVVAIVFSGSRTNPPVERSIIWDSESSKDLFYRACADCHSNETKWPWYSHIAPVSWLVIGNVNEGRGDFNISLMNMGEIEEAPKKVLNKVMPPSDYLLLHSEADLTKTERETLANSLSKISDATKGVENEKEENGDND